MGDMDYAKGVDAGRYTGAVNVANPKSVISQKRTRVIPLFIAADSAANTNLAEQVVHALGPWAGGAKVTNIHVRVVTNVTTGNSTNYAVLKFQSRDNAQGAAVQVGIVNCAVTNLTAFVATAFTLNSTALSIASLGQLTYRHDKVGASGSAGLQLPAYTLLLFIEDT